MTSGSLPERYLAQPGRGRRTWCSEVKGEPAGRRTRAESGAPAPPNANAHANLDQGFVGAVAQRLVSALLAAAKVHSLAFRGVIFHGCEA